MFILLFNAVLQVNLIVYAYQIPNFIKTGNISVPATNNGSYDPCRYFQISNSFLYRMGKSNIIQKWDLNTMNLLSQNRYYTPTWTDNISNIGVNTDYEDLTVALSGTKDFDVLNASNLSIIDIFSNSSGSPVKLSKVQTTMYQYLLLTYSSNGIALLKLLKETLQFIKAVPFPGLTGKVNSTLSKNQQIILVWHISSGIVKILQYNSTKDWSIIGCYMPEINSTTMNSIALSDNGTIAVFQYDSKAKLTVYNISSLSIIAQISFTNTIINQIIFLDKDCHLIAVTLNYTTIQIYDIFNLTLQSTQSLSSVSNYSAIDYKTGLLYFCLPQNIKVYQIQCPIGTVRSILTNQCVNEVDSSTNYISSEQEITANATISGFKIISPVIQTLFTTLQMTPFAIFFLSFINYWNLCCLYSILSVNAPAYLATIHQIIFDSIQSSLFQLFGYNPSVPFLNSMSVKNTFRVNYQIMLDFFNSNFQNFLTLSLVFIIICAILLIKKHLIQKDSCLRKYLKFNICQIMLCQFISFVPFCIIPFRFFSLHFTRVEVKINATLQVFLLFICMMSPVILFWSFKKYKNQTKLLKNQHKKCKKENSSSIQKKQKTIYFLNLKAQKVQQLRFCVLGVTVPILIILPFYWPFFIINFIIFIRRIKDALNLKKYRINYIITSLYFPIYHCCYLIFYIFQGNQYIVHYTGILCIVILLVGGIHQISNILLLGTFQAIIQLIKICKKIKQKDKNQQQNKLDKSPFNNKVENQFQVSFQLDKIEPSIAQSFKPIKKIKSDYSTILKQKNQLQINFDEKIIKEQGAMPIQKQFEDIVNVDAISKLDKLKIVKKKDSFNNLKVQLQNPFQVKEDQSSASINQSKQKKQDANEKTQRIINQSQTATENENDIRYKRRTLKVKVSEKKSI